MKIWRNFIIFILVLLLSLTPSLLGIAQNKVSQNPTPETATTEQKIDGIPVVLDGKTLFWVKSGIGSFSAKERVNFITKKIEKIAQDSSISLDNLTIKNIPDDKSIYLDLDGTVILSVTPQDAKIAKTSQEQLAQKAQQIIKQAIEEYRKERTPAEIIQGIIATALASLALLFISWGMIKFSGVLFPRIRSWIESRIPSLRIQTFEIISSYQISKILLRILQVIRFTFLLTIFYFYLSFVLSLFPSTRVFGKQLLSYVIKNLEKIENGILAFLPNLFTVAVIILITSYIIRFIKPFFNAIQNGNLVIPGFYADWAEPTYNIVLFLIIALAAIIAFPYLPGFDSPAFKGVSVFLGILFSLGSTSAISNFVGGIILIYARAFQIGDRVQVGDVIGDIIEKGLLVTRIRTPTNKVITIPNSSLMNSNVTNFTVSTRELASPLIIQTTITLGYDLPWRKVHETLVKAALETPNILANPSPFVLQISLDDFYVSYVLNAYTNQPSLMVITASEMHQNIQDKCNEVGIEIMSPHYSNLRDGNQITIPENYLSSDYTAPPFRIQPLDNGEKNNSKA